MAGDGSKLYQAGERKKDWMGTTGPFDDALPSSLEMPSVIWGCLFAFGYGYVCLCVSFFFFLSE